MHILSFGIKELGIRGYRVTQTGEQGRTTDGWTEVALWQALLFASSSAIMTGVLEDDWRPTYSKETDYARGQRRHNASYLYN